MASIEFPTLELNRAVDAVVNAIEQRRRETCKIVGTQLLSFIQWAYDEKSRGGTGNDGIKWAPLKVGTILARLRKAGHLKSSGVKKAPKPAEVSRPRRRTQYTVKKTVNQNAALFEELERAGVGFHDKKGKKITGKAARHKAGTTVTVDTATRKKTIHILPGAYEIGVDSGKQRNSINAGFPGPNGLGSIFESNQGSVTLGFGLSYSLHFDKHRALIPNTLSDAWQQELEALAARHGAIIVEETLGQQGVT